MIGGFALVVAGAAVGAPLRFWVDRAVQSRRDSVFPWGTFIVNITGSLILGALAGLPTPDGVMTLVGVGFCGALTTYSTFGYETLRLVQGGASRFAALNVIGSVSAGLGAGCAGFLLAQVMTG